MGNQNKTNVLENLLFFLVIGLAFISTSIIVFGLSILFLFSEEDTRKNCFIGCDVIEVREK